MVIKEIKASLAMLFFSSNLILSALTANKLKKKGFEGAGIKPRISLSNSDCLQALVCAFI